MAREPIIQPTVISSDEDRDLRPQRMRDMVGQRDVHERLGIAVDAASKRGEPLGHLLLDGPPGLGKTTFATCIPHDLGVSVQIASGAALAAPKDLLPYHPFCRSAENDVGQSQPVHAPQRHTSRLNGSLV